MALTLFRVAVSLLWLLCTNICTALLPTQLIYQFPNGTFVENIAVRSEGSLLVTLITSPELYSIQPNVKNPNPQLVYRFPNASSVTGITEVSSDSFLVGVTTVAGPGQAVPGSSSLWTVDFSRRRDQPPQISKTADIPDVTAPNGLVTLNTNKVLLADSGKGLVFVVDLDTGVSSVAINDPLFAVVPNAPPVGVNGLKIKGKTLYFTTSGQNLLGQVEIDKKTGSAKGPATKIVSSLPPGIGYDDFALSENGKEAYAANAFGDFVERIDLKTKKQEIVAGQLNSTEIAEPTSAAFGRNGKEDTLFVTTGGGLFFPVNGDEIVGGQVVAVKLGKK